MVFVGWDERKRIPAFPNARAMLGFALLTANLLSRDVTSGAGCCMCLPR